MKQTPPKIVILGPQGAGKGTQASHLARHYHIPHISAGDLLRAEARRGTVLGKRIANIIDKGRLVPNELMSALVRQRLKEPDAKKGWILDAYPRFLTQARTFQHFAPPFLVILLNLTDAQAIRRLSGRVICPKGHIYHLEHQRPKKRGYCDRDGLALVHRADDMPQAIRRRLKWHHRQTDPLIRKYRHLGILVEINAAPPIPIVYRSVLEQLDSLPSWPSSRHKTI